MDTSPKKKVGKLSSDDETTISKLYKDGKTIQEIAVAINRNTEPVTRFIKFKLDSLDEQDETEGLTRRLKSQKYWQEAQRMFSLDELAYFLDLWVDICMQFKEVLATEEMQVKELITTEILSNRCLKESKEQQDEVGRVSVELQKEREQPDGIRNDAMIMNLEQQLIALKTSVGAYASKFVQLSDRKKDINKSLKATREQRISRIESSKESWVDLVKMLQDDKVSKEEGREAELFAIATAKAKEKMSQVHTYINGEADYPLLTAEVILKEEGKEHV